MGSRINNQVRRGLHRIEDALGQVERNQTQLKSNADQVVTEIDEIHRRLTLALKERTDYLKSSVDKYVLTEMKSLKELKDNLDLEVTNIQSNSDLMEKNLDDGTKWDDVELMDCKDIFIKMMDWIRNYKIWPQDKMPSECRTERSSVIESCPCPPCPSPCHRELPSSEDPQLLASLHSCLSTSLASCE